MKFKIPCKWTLRTVEVVEARSLDEAESKAMQLTRPADASAGELEAELFPVDLERMAKMHPIPVPPDPMRAWKKTRSDTFNHVWERRFGRNLVTVWAHGDPEDGVGPWFPEYCWTIRMAGDDAEVSSHRTFDSPEDAAKAAEVKLKVLGG